MENVKVFWAHAQLLNVRITTSRSGRGGKNKKQEQKKRRRTGPSRRPICSEGALWVLKSAVWHPGWRKAEGYTEHLADLTLD